MIAPKEINLTINGKRCTGQAGDTILEVAQANDIYIPTLCHMKHLSPWGGCRLCIVEIAGSAKVVPSCSKRCLEASGWTFMPQTGSRAVVAKATWW